MYDQNRISVKEADDNICVYVQSEDVDVTYKCSKVIITIIDEATKQYNIDFRHKSDVLIDIYTKDLPLLIDEKLGVKTIEYYKGFEAMEITRRVKQ